MPIWARRRGRPVPMPRMTRPGAISSTAPTVIAPSRIRLHGWRHPAILAAALLTVASGFAQFGSTAALGTVARTFGQVQAGGGPVAAHGGLSGTTIRIGPA